MRISDWSSDVCSSDLRHPLDLLIDMDAIMPVLAHYPDHRGALDGKGHMTAPRRDIMMAPDQGPIGKCEGKAVRHSASGQVEQAFHKIGRASCRERVCKYV